MPGTLLVAKYTLVNKSDRIPVWVRAPEGNRWHIQRVILKSLIKEGRWIGTEALARELYNLQSAEGPRVINTLRKLTFCLPISSHESPSTRSQRVD